MKKIYVLLFQLFLFSLATAQTCTPTITASPSAICQGQSVTLKGSGANTYTWSTGVSLDSITVTPSATDTYTLTATTGTCVASATITILVNPNPTVAAAGCPVCAGDPCNLTCNGAITYTWMPGGYSGSPFNVSPSSTTVYTVAGSDANGCVSTATAVVTVNPDPTVTITGGTSICSGGSITLCGNGALSYTWWPCPTFGTSFPGNCYTDNPTSSTCYTLVGSDVNGCMGSAYTNITVNPAPGPSFTLQADPTPHVWDAYPSYSGGTAPYTYSWDWGDGSTSMGAYPSHTYSVAARYNICVSITDANGCVASYCENDSVYRMANTKKSTGMTQLNVINGSMAVKNIDKGDLQIKMYPNPANTNVNINSTAKISGITIYDVIGNTVEKTTSPGMDTNGTIDLSKLQEGVYFVSIKTVSGSNTQKLVVKR